MIKNISNLGDAAVYCDFGNEVNKEVNLKVISFFQSLKEAIKENEIKGINNLTPSYNKLIISFDPAITNYENIEKTLRDFKFQKNYEKESKKIKIPICCEEEYALDLKYLSEKLNLQKNEILKLYLNKEYFCYMTGFIAGMPFLGDINKNLRIDRLQTLRVRVPKGSVGITEQFCNIYTFESPGGWNIIGNTPKKIFDKKNLDNPSLIKPGDKIIFFKISKEEYLNWNE